LRLIGAAPVLPCRSLVLQPAVIGQQRNAFDPICFAALERALSAIEGDLARPA
jgi:hypothetical protein